MEKLVSLAKDLGFESKFVSDKPYKYSNKENLRKLFWLTELKQFVFTTWGCSIDTSYRSDGLFEYFMKFKLDDEFTDNSSKLAYNTEVEALFAGLFYFIQEMSDLESM